MHTTNFKRSHIVIFILLILYGLYSLLFLLNDIDRNFWDYKVYCLAVKCYENNLNPYHLEDLSKVSGNKWVLPFLYPPITLKFFKIFVLEKFEYAIYFFFFTKVLLLIAVLIIWQKILVVKKLLWFLIFVLLAFNSAIIKDFTSGNITIFLQFFIWLGIFFYTKQKYLYFNIFILLASFFKIVPILFLGLNLFSDNKNKFHYLSGSVLVFAFYILINYIIEPSLFMDFVNNLGTVFNEKGILNPSIYALIKDCFYNLFKETYNPDQFKATELVVYIIIISTIAFFSFRKYIQIKKSDRISEPDKKLILIFLFCLMYSFLLPKFKDYEYMLLILPAFYIIFKVKDIPVFYFIMFICLISCINISPPVFRQIYILMWHYYPLIIALGIWSLYMIMITKWTKTNNVSEQLIPNTNKE